MPSKRKLGPEPDLGNPGLTITAKLPGGAVVRELLTADLLNLCCNRFQDDRRFKNEEVKWLLDALLWLNWHAGKVTEKHQMEGLDLHRERPAMAEQ